MVALDGDKEHIDDLIESLIAFGNFWMPPWVDLILLILDPVWLLNLDPVWLLILDRD